jgi:hypothetical protein
MGSRSIDQARRFHDPLDGRDTPDQTVGCRHTNPDICAKHSISLVCAFVRADGMCLSPPKSWPKQFKVLLRRKASIEDGR